MFMTAQYRIGKFAYLSGISAKTLRFYDEIGLLRPAAVDARTRYRFYRPQQLGEAASIIALRELGMPLADIRNMNRRGALKKDWRGILGDLKKSAERTIQTATQTLNWINATLAEQEDSRVPIPVIVKHRRSVHIASVRSIVKTYGDIELSERRLLNALPRPCVGELRGVLWHHCAASGGVLEGEPFVALKQPLAPGLAYELKLLPQATLACAYSATDEHSAAQAYEAISKWAEVRGFRLAGPKREIYLDQMLEIQFPIEAT
jgi:DNA-binding transcriptional MerR regulator